MHESDVTIFYEIRQLYSKLQSFIINIVLVFGGGGVQSTQGRITNN